MSFLSKLLVPVDFSANSLMAVREAATLAARSGAQITLLHVIGFPPPFSRPLQHSTAAVPAAEVFEQRRQFLDDFASSCLKNLEIKRVVSRGDPAQMIAARAHSDQTDLILMATHGYGPVRRFLLGSVTAKVLHDADRPVWTLHPERNSGVELPQIRHVMCAVNFRPQDPEAIRWADALAREFGAQLTLAHAVSPTPSEMPERYAFTWHEEACWGADERLGMLLADAKVCAEPLVVEGEMPLAITSAAKEHNADVLVIGRNQATSRSGRLGHTCYGIVCQPPCPVVSV